MFRLLAAAIATAALAASACGAAELEARQNEAARAIDLLAADLAMKVISPDKNVCFSPYSISSAFAMAYAGAAGSTADEMKDALHYTDGIHDANAKLVKSFADAPDEAGELMIANSVWPRREFRFRSAFKETIERAYSSEIHTQDYEEDPERACAEINGWVSERTKGMIENIVSPASITPSTSMILINAVYFKAPWRDAFDASRTSSETFRAPGGDRSVDMMKNTDPYLTYDGDGYRAIDIPYGYGIYSMTIILPDEGIDDDAVASIVAKVAIGGDERTSSRRMTELWLPKFRIETTLELNDMMQELGVVSAFKPQEADFSAMNGARDLYVNEAIHKAVIDVDEEGTEAAAATSIGINATAMMEPAEPAVFHADRPFAYIVRDTVSGAVLFMGFVAAP